MAHLAPAASHSAVLRMGDDADVGCTPAVGRWVLIATIAGSGMAFIDSTVVNVLLPALQAEMGATAAQLQWVVESYALVLAALILVGGALGDHYGRNRVYGLGVLVFAASSVACGFARDPLQLIGARAVQGMGGALLIPGSLAIIAATFGDRERGRAVGTWSAFTGLTAAGGPILGGWLVDNLSWRWAFFINVIPAVLVLLIVWRKIPETRARQGHRPLDWGAAALTTVGLGGLVFGLIEAGVPGASTTAVAVPALVGGVALVAFVAWERRTSDPMVPLGLFRNRRFAGAQIITLFLYAALGSTLYFLPFDLIQVQGYSATEAGASFLPFIVIMFALSRWTGTLVDRIGALFPLTAGPAIAAIGFALLAVPGIGGSFWVTFFPAIVVLGVGMALTVAPLTTVVMSCVEQERAGLASGINNAVSRVASLLAIAALGIVVAQFFGRALDEGIASLDLDVEQRADLDRQRVNLAGAQPPAGLDPATEIAVRDAVAGAYVAGFRRCSLAGAGLALLSALIGGWSMRRSR